MKHVRSFPFFGIFILSLLLRPASAHSGDSHGDHSGEIGVSAGVVRLDDENRTGLNLHAHLSLKLSDHGRLSRFGIGFGFETIFAGHRHYGIMGSFIAQPFHALAISVAPGLILSDHGGGWETGYSTHIEMTYGFSAGDFEIGPFAGCAVSSGDRHYSAGLHFGTPF
ncbi:hypothetical protein JW777_00845 [bacterium]|nr:hypothetical protein [bacterium]